MNNAQNLSLKSEFKINPVRIKKLIPYNLPCIRFKITSQTSELSTLTDWLSYLHCRSNKLEKMANSILDADFPNLDPTNFISIEQEQLHPPL